MAINPNTQYPGKIAPPSVDYPYGEARNITAPGDGTGTPWEAAFVNDLFGLLQALLKSAAIVPTGTSEKVGASQVLQSLIELVSGRAFNYDESGIADAYILDSRTDLQAPASYFDGLVIRFTPGFANTGASTIKIDPLGIVNLLDDTGAALVGGELLPLQQYEARYDGVNFRLLKPIPTPVIDPHIVRQWGYAIASLTPPTVNPNFMDVAVDPATGNLISYEDTTNSIYIHDGISPTILSSFGGPGVSLVRITVDPATSNLISHDGGASLIRIHDGISATILSSFSPPGGTSTMFLAVDPATGNLISSDTNTDTIFIHDGISATILSSFAAPVANNQISGLAVDPGTGNLISGNNGTDLIYTHDGITSAILDTIGTLSVSGLGLVVDPTTGNLISTDSNNNFIHIHPTYLVSNDYP